MKSVKIKRIDLVAALKKHAIFALICSILLLAVGVLFCVVPGYTSVTVIWVAFGLVALVGLAGIVRFIFPGKGNKRDGFALAFGIILDAIFAILLCCAFFAPEGNYQIWGEWVHFNGFGNFSIGLIIFFSIFAGVLAVLSGIFSLCTIGSVESGKKGVTIASSIVNLILGVLMIIFPGIFWFVGCIITGIYLIIISIFGIVITSKAIDAARKAKKNGIKLEADVVEIKDDGKDVIENK